MFHVTNLTPPGSERPYRRHAGQHELRGEQRQRHRHVRLGPQYRTGGRCGIHGGDDILMILLPLLVIVVFVSEVVDVHVHAFVTRRGGEEEGVVVRSRSRQEMGVQLRRRPGVRPRAPPPPLRRRVGLALFTSRYFAVKTRFNQ
jgi:hypothetical protein